MGRRKTKRESKAMGGRTSFYAHRSRPFADALSRFIWLRDRLVGRELASVPGEGFAPCINALQMGSGWVRVSFLDEPSRVNGPGT